MLPEKNRLRGSLAFDEVKGKGKMYQSDNFGLLVRNREDKDPSRFGIVVSTKISKKAVDRNRVKRQVRKAIRNYLGKIKDGHDAIVLARKGLLSVEPEYLDKEIKKALEESKLI